MNLVAKEFVASQDDNDPGVLILSPFAGAGGKHFAMTISLFRNSNMAKCYLNYEIY